MNKQVEELVDWVAERMYHAHYDLTLWDDLHENIKVGWREGAKEILSHPDLALIDREKLGECIHYVEGAMGEQELITPEEYVKELPIIPLAEALK